MTESYFNRSINIVANMLLPMITMVGALFLAYQYLMYAHEPKYEIVILFIAIVACTLFLWISPKLFFYFAIRMLAVLLFFGTFYGICFSILFYEYLPFSDPSRLREAQILLAVSSSGMMGGLMRYFSNDGVIENDNLSLWYMIHAAIVGLFVSVVLFLILRAGIINQPQIDTFNVWGITGVAAITGFFADRVIDRFSSLYNEVVGNSKKSSESS